MSKKRKKTASSESVYSAEASSQEAPAESVQDQPRKKRPAADEQVKRKKNKKKSAETAGKSGKKRKTGKSASGKQKSSSSAKKKRKKNSLFPQQGDSVFEVLRKTVFLMSATVFVVCIALIAKYFWENYQNMLVNKEMQELYGNPVHHEYVPEEKDNPSEPDRFFLLSGASNLYAINPDVVGFIEVKDILNKTKSEICYPILQYKPDDHNDPDTNGNEYYLNRNIYGEQEKAGSIFMDFRNYFDYIVPDKKDYDGNGNLVTIYGLKYDNSDNLIIYGHNMHDYSMFGSLKRYINDATYYDSHPIVNLNSNIAEYKYKVFGMIIVDIDDETDTKFEYWNTLDFFDEETFYDYVNEVKRRTVRLTDVDVTYGDQILTLSTCNSTFSEGRLVVFARLLREGEDELEGCTSTPNPNIKWPNSYYKWRKKTYDPNAEFIPYG